MFDEFVLRQSLDDDSMPNKRMTGILVYARACRPRLVALGSADSFVNGIRNFDFTLFFSGSKRK